MVLDVSLELQIYYESTIQYNSPSLVVCLSSLLNAEPVATQAPTGTVVGFGVSRMWAKGISGVG